jgi:enamine deaminase RidA (YjgF/YER057c/UK114 family)
MRRTNLYSNSPWEKKVAYSRAVVVGNMVEVSGTVANDGSGPVHVDSAYLQTKFILKRIKNALYEVESDLSDVVRTRIYVTDINIWEEVGKAHQECFQGIDPVTTLVEVSALISPEYLVEIEATAILGQLGHAHELTIKE